MPNFVTGFPRQTGESETDLKKLFDWSVSLVDELKWLFNNLDSGNVIEAASVKDKVVRAETIIAQTVITDTLYAEYGEIADLTVNKISTSHKIYKYLTQDITDDLYFEGYENGIYWCQACVKLVEGAAMTTQLTNHDGRLLYWQRPIATTSGGMVFDEDGVRIGLTTKNTSVPCMVYDYNVLTKAMFSYWDDGTGTKTPVVCMGAGNGSVDYPNSGKAFIYKDTDGIQIDYNRDNKVSKVYLGNDGNVFRYVNNNGEITAIEMDEVGGRFIGDWNLSDSSNILFINCLEDDLVDNIPDNTPDGTLVGNLNSIAYANSKNTLRFVGNLYYYEKQYCIFNGIWVIGYTAEGANKSDITLAGKYFDTVSNSEKTAYQINLMDSSLGCDLDMVYTNLNRLIIPSDFADSSHTCYIVNLGNCPNLSELIAAPNSFNCSVNAFSNCPKLTTVKFTKLNSSLQSFPIGVLFSGSYVENIYFNKDFTPTASPLFLGGLSEKIAIHGDGIGNLSNAAIVNCSNLKEIVLGEGITGASAGTFQNLSSLEVLEIRKKDYFAFMGDLNSDDSGVFIGCKSGFKLRCYSSNTSVQGWAESYGLEVELVEE